MHTMTRASGAATPPREFWGLTAFFDTAGSSLVLANLQRFSTRVRAQGLRLAIVELAFGDAPFRVPATWGDLVLRHRARDVMWQKERLLNAGVAALPAACRYVAWLDGDLLFENDQWVGETRARLDDYPVVQPFECAAWLDEGAETARPGLPRGMGEGHTLPGFACTLAGCDDRAVALADFDRHGHTGFAWAARRDLLATHGLYDRAILGGGDFIAAHAFAADADYLRGRHWIARDLTPAERQAIAAWGRPVAAATGGRIGWTPGRVLHQYHGPASGRRYVERMQILRAANFDPIHDIAVDAGGCWAWATDKPALHAAVAGYFADRAAAAAPGRATA
ncbi:MAG: hypothetical protein AB7O67_17960 [Vicinamibacterales bacterium]